MDDFVAVIEKYSDLEEAVYAYVEQGAYYEEGNAEIYENKIFKFIESSDPQKTLITYSVIMNMLSNTSFSRHGKECVRKIVFLINVISSTFKMKDILISNLLFNIFKHNKLVLLLLFEDGLIDIRSIEYEINMNTESELLEYFFPEIYEKDKSFFIYACSHYTVNFLYQKIFANIKQFKKNRLLGHSPCQILKIIRKDDIDGFISFSSQTNLDFTSTVEKSIFEINEYINGIGTTLIDYAAFFGSINIFKFLLLNKIGVSQNTLQMATCGGNYDIIHLLENKGIEFSMDCFHNSILFHWPFIFDYYCNMYEKNVEEFEIDLCINSYNFVLLKKILENELSRNFYIGKIIDNAAKCLFLPFVLLTLNPDSKKYYNYFGDVLCYYLPRSSNLLFIFFF